MPERQRGEYRECLPMRERECVPERERVCVCVCAPARESARAREGDRESMFEVALSLVGSNIYIDQCLLCSFSIQQNIGIC